MLHDRVRLVRIHRHHSVRRWATVSGYTASSISRWESGAVPPPAEYLQYLVSLGVNGHWLLTGEGGMDGVGGDPDIDWLRRSGLESLAAATDPEILRVIEWAIAGLHPSVSSAAIRKVLKCDAARSEAVLGRMTSAGLVVRARSGWRFRSLAKPDSRGHLAVGLLRQLGTVLSASERGESVASRFGALTIKAGTKAEVWERLARAFEGIDDPEGTETMNIVLAASTGAAKER